MKEKIFHRCSICGNLVDLLHNGGGSLVCCGEPMQLLEPNTSDGAGEKHLPIPTVNADTVHVQVGSVLHPSTEEHYIEWIYLQSENGDQRKHLKPGDVPEADFSLVHDKPIAVYAYCNLHGLWKTQL